jgi:thiol:disulfide interchange protein
VVLWWGWVAALAGPDVLDRYAPADHVVIEPDPFGWQVAPLAMDPGTTGTLVLRLAVPAGTHVYRDQIDVQVADGAGLAVGKADLPPGLLGADPADADARTDAKRELYDQDVMIEVPITAPADARGLFTVLLDAHHQGCRPGLCYPPVTTRLEVMVHVAPPSIPPAPEDPNPYAPEDLK